MRLAHYSIASIAILQVLSQTKITKIGKQKHYDTIYNIYLQNKNIKTCQ